MKKILLSLILLSTVLASPYVTTPVAIDNTVILNNSTDYAIFKLAVINPDNTSYFFYIQPISITWDFITNKSIFNLPPHSKKELIIKLRPIQKTTELPMAFVIIQNDTNKYKYTLYFPVVVVESQTSKTKKYLYNIINVSVYILKKKVFAGEAIPLILHFFSNIEKNIPINITSNLFKLSYNITVWNKTTVTIPIEIPSAALPGIYTIYIKIDNLTERAFNITVLKPVKIIVNNTTNEILVYNPNNYVVSYKLKKEISLADKLFYIFQPRPSYEIIENGKHYYVWDIVLLPHEEYTIKKTLNVINAAIFILLAILSLVYIVLSYISPKVLLEKEIIKVDNKNNTIKIMITIKNKSFYKVKKIKVKEYLLPIFEPLEFEFIKPIGVYNKNNSKIIEWFIDELLPGEERVIVYTVKYKSEVVGELEIDSAVAEFVIFGKKHVVRSNKLILRFV